MPMKSDTPYATRESHQTQKEWVSPGEILPLPYAESGYATSDRYGDKSANQSPPEDFSPPYLYYWDYHSPQMYIDSVEAPFHAMSSDSANLSLWFQQAVPHLYKPVSVTGQITTGAKPIRIKSIVSHSIMLLINPNHQCGRKIPADHLYQIIPPLQNP